MENIKEMLEKIASRTLYLRILREMCAPKSVLKRQKKALETARREVREYEAKHGQIPENVTSSSG